MPTIPHTDGVQGKRNTATNTTVTRASSIRIQEDLWREFKAATAYKGTNMTEVMESLIKAWLAKNRHTTAA